jgi:hypothetical protein
MCDLGGVGGGGGDVQVGVAREHVEGDGDAGQRGGVEEGVIRVGGARGLFVERERREREAGATGRVERSAKYM